MRVGITGATGILGKTVLDRSSNLEWSKFTGDIKAQSDIDDWLNESRGLSGIIHLAAVVPTREVEENPLNALDVNVGGTCRLMCSIAKGDNGKPRPWVFLASTSHVYDSSEKPLSEDSLIRPISTYGLTKYQSEAWARCLALKFTIPLCIGRIFSYSAASQPNSYFLPAMIDKIRNTPRAGRLEIPGLNGSRDFLAAEAVANCILELLKKRFEGTLNIASGVETHLLEVVKVVCDKLDRRDIEIIVLPQDTYHLRADISRLQSIIPRETMSFHLDDFLNTVLVR